MPLLSTFGAGSTRGWGRAMRLVRPGAPTSLVVTGYGSGNSTALVTFSPPVDNGGGTITSYRLYNITDGGYQTLSGSGQTIGLTNQNSTTVTERAYYLTAINAAGESDSSNQDQAINFYTSTGNGTYYYVPRTTTVSWQMYSGSGQSYKPDTRQYGNVEIPNTWYDNYGGWNYGYQHPGEVPYSYASLANYSWWTYDTNWNYVYGYYQYAFGGVGNQYYYMQGYGYSSTHGTYFSGTQMGGAYTYTSNSVIAGSPPSGPSYGGQTIVYVQNVGEVQRTGQGYNQSAAYNAGSYTVPAGSWIRMDHGYSGDAGAGGGYSSQGYGYFYYGY
jgi:hypothetical protein